MLIMFPVLYAESVVTQFVGNCVQRSRRRLKKRAALFIASRGMPANRQSATHDGVSGEETTSYRRTGGRAGRDDRYPALLPGVDKAPSGTGNTRNSFISDDVEKLYDFTAAAADAAGRGAVACPAVMDYAPAVERASSAVDVGRTLALFGTDRLYQSACPLCGLHQSTCPLCVHPGGSTAWTREAVYVGQLMTTVESSAVTSSASSRGSVRGAAASESAW